MAWADFLGDFLVALEGDEDIAVGRGSCLEGLVEAGLGILDSCFGVEGTVAHACNSSSNVTVLELRIPVSRLNFPKCDASDEVDERCRMLCTGRSALFGLSDDGFDQLRVKFPYLSYVPEVDADVDVEVEVEVDRENPDPGPYLGRFPSLTFAITKSEAGAWAGGA